MSERPTQAYLFAHRALPVLTFADPGKTLAVLGGPDGARFLRDAWDHVGRHCPPEVRREPEGLAHSVQPTGTTGLVAVVQLPEPEEIGEAALVAIFGRFQDPAEPDLSRLKWVRLFTLELGQHPIGDGRCWMLCEWTEEGQHHNYGEGPPPVEQDFVEAALDLLWAQTERAGQPPV